MSLAFMPLTDHRTFDQYYDPLWEASHLLLIPGEEANGSPHAIVLGAADSIVQGAARPDRPGFVHVQQSVWDAHSQGALWSVAHPDDGETNKDDTPNIMANVQGMDLVEMWNHASNVDKEIVYSENRWNAGFRFGVAGASDNHFREYWDRQGPGLPTTSVLAATRTERGVVDGLKAGHVTLSIDPTGPELLLSSDLNVKGRPAQGGDEVIAPAGTRGHLRLRVRHAAGMQVLVYRQPGRSAGPFRTFSPKGDDETFSLDITTGPAPDWYRAEIRGLSVATPTAPAAMELKAATSPLFLSPSPVEARPEIPVPADQGHDDGAVRAAGAAGVFDGFPDIATEVPAWESRGLLRPMAKEPPSILYRRRDAKGWSGAGLTISGKAPARFPRVAAHGRDVWVTWQEDAVQVPHRPVIRLRHSPDGGKTWRATTTVRALAGRAEHPVIAISAAGHPVLAWEEIQAGQPFDVLVQEIGRDGSPRNLSRPGKVFHPADPDDTRTARYPASVWPAIAASPDGRIAVAWQDDRDDIDPLWTGSAAAAGTNPDAWRIEVAVRDPSDGWRDPAKFGDAQSANRHPDLAFDRDGQPGRRLGNQGAKSCRQEPVDHHDNLHGRRQALLGGWRARVRSPDHERATAPRPRRQGRHPHRLV